MGDYREDLVAQRSSWVDLRDECLRQEESYEGLLRTTVKTRMIFEHHIARCDEKLAALGG